MNAIFFILKYDSLTNLLKKALFVASIKNLPGGAPTEKLFVIIVMKEISSGCALRHPSLTGGICPAFGRPHPCPAARGFANRHKNSAIERARCAIFIPLCGE